MTAVITFIAFVGILWAVGGALTVGGVTIPGFMVFAAIIYAVVVSGLMVAVGANFAQRFRERSEAEAQFRYELTRLRENAESVALVRGEDGEKRSLVQRYSTVVDKWRQYVFRWSYMTLVVNSSNLAAPIIPVLLMGPKYLTGEATLGTVMQAATAFGTVQSALGWITSNFARLSEWYASASRVAELNAYIQAAAKPGEATNRIEVKSSESETLHLDDVVVRLHNGKTLIADADFSVGPGEMVMVMGKSGTGKSILVRAIAGLWPWGSGIITLPKGADIAFVPQRPYLPVGTLRSALSYPRAVVDVPDDVLVGALRQCGLDSLTQRLDDSGAWDRMLSGGEQQRLAFARLIIHRPSMVILDEAISALDDESQASLMNLFQTELPGSLVISVANRPKLARYHNRQINLKKQKAGTRAVDRLRKMTGWTKVRSALASARKIRSRPGASPTPGPLQ